jgi:hypothetical protein
MSGNQAYLDNTMLGETIIYCDEKGVKSAAIILHPTSDEVVDLMMFPNLVPIKDVPFNHKVEAIPGTWWRRNKF